MAYWADDDGLRLRQQAFDEEQRYAERTIQQIMIHLDQLIQKAGLEHTTEQQE